MHDQQLNTQVPTSTRSTSLYVRGVGLVLLGTFVSLWAQLDVLLGKDGVMPVATQLNEHVDFWRRPSLLWWWGDSDAALRALMLLGLLGAAMMVLDRVRPLAVLSTGAAYLSVVSAGGVFFHFQWDNLVMEALLLCLLLPWRREQAPSVFVVWAFRLLLFRLCVESGVAKWAWGDESWGTHRAMDHYYETSPLPLLMGFFLHQAPHGWHVMEEVATFALELFLPLGFFLPRRWRVWTLPPGLALQAMIAATSSYGSFNLMSALLFLWLVDDDHWSTWFSRVFPSTTEPLHRPRWRSTLLCTAVSAHLALNTYAFVSMMDGRFSSTTLETVEHVLAPWRVMNTWHLFANVTLTRPVIEIQGSDDGVNWTSYHFRYSPGAKDGLPPLWLAPHHPRIPFQMWFLALSPRREAWFDVILAGLCKERSPVHELFTHVPETPPRHLRVNLLDYRMTTLDHWWETGETWSISLSRLGNTVDCP